MEIKLDGYSADIKIEVKCPDCSALVVWNAGPRDCWFETDKLAVLPFECLVCHSSGAIHLVLS